MINISITIPDEYEELAKEVYGYEEILHNYASGEDEPNPLTPTQFIKKAIIKDFQDRAARVEKRKAVEQATLTDTSSL